MADKTKCVCWRLVMMALPGERGLSVTFLFTPISSLIWRNGSSQNSMAKIDKWEAADRIAAMDDEKKRALDLYDMRLVPPEDVLIFDEPTRCYRINKQWAAYVMGMVSWLAEIAPWKDADDESYFAIEEI